MIDRKPWNANMYLNNISVNSRHSNPSVLSRTALAIYFFNDGRYADPYEISAVSVFRSADNYYPSSVIGSDGQILSTASSLVLANFANTAALTTDSSFDTSNYSIGASGIYRIREGVYVVVLDNSTDTYNFNLSGDATISNGVSATGDYIDVWTIRRTAGSDLDTIINEFTLNDDRFFATTEPVMFRVSTKMLNKFLILGSKEDLKFTNEFTIENMNIDRSMKNLFKTSFVMNPAIEIVKVNEGQNIPAKVTVSSFAQTSSLCEVTSDNTVLFNFNSDSLLTHPELLAGNFAGIHGVYQARLKFTALGQTFMSNYLPFTIR